MSKDCEHSNLEAIRFDIPLETVWICRDCGAWIDEKGEVIREPLDEIPY